MKKLLLPLIFLFGFSYSSFQHLKFTKLKTEQSKITVSVNEYKQEYVQNFHVYKDIDSKARIILDLDIAEKNKIILTDAIIARRNLIPCQPISDVDIVFVRKSEMQKTAYELGFANSPDNVFGFYEDLSVIKENSKIYVSDSLSAKELNKTLIHELYHMWDAKLCWTENDKIGLAQEEKNARALESFYE